MNWQSNTKLIMQPIEHRIKLLRKIDLSKDEFINDELKPFVSFSFKSNNDNLISVEIKPYQTGFPFFNLYRNNYISEAEINEEKMAKPASRWASHYGEYLVYDLPTLYFQMNDPISNENYLVIFGLGESQLGKGVCKISGVWQIRSASGEK